MALMLFNTMGRKKQELKPIKPGFVGMYCCGPTVYNYAHIGNLRTYVFEDILKRVLLYNNLKLKHVMNITDVGHLTSDADEGEDKMDKTAKKEGKTPEQIAEFYTLAFKKDIKHLNISEPDIWCKATEHIKEMIELIKRIEKNGYAYVTGGNVYFDTGKFKDYGELAGLRIEELKAGARVDVDENKKHPRDFVLWFTESKFKGHLQNWNSPWGEGFPGWHIECSAMSMKYLGEHFDIHCGGIDHISVHHTNEIAQSEAATGKKWVNYWIHGEFLVMDKGKMAKSAGTFITLQTLIDKGYNPLTYRFFCLGTHYRMPLTFSWEALDGASNAYKTLKNRIAMLKKENTSFDHGTYEKYYEEEFMKRINDDLNMPRTLAVLNDLIQDHSLGSKEKLKLIGGFDKVLGLELLKEESTSIKRRTATITADAFIVKSENKEEILKLVEQREEARKKKDFKLSDKIRTEIKAKGFVVEDTPEGPRVKKI